MKRKLLTITMIVALVAGLGACSNNAEEKTSEENLEANEQVNTTTSATSDATTSASVVPEEFVQNYTPKGFTEGDNKKALFVVADPRDYSVNYDLANTAMKYFEDNGVEVELRDLYDLKFDPIISEEEFYYYKDGDGEPTDVIKEEQEFVTQSDYIVFVYPNWHDTPTPLVKGYMEKVFAKQFAYKDTEEGLEGLLKDKAIYTIMNAGYLGGGRGDIGDGVGIDDELWDEYMYAYKVFDDDTAGFWGLENKGRFVNDRTPSNDSDNYKEEIEQLRADLSNELKNVFFK